MSDRKIAIDIRLWTHPGIGRYIRELVDVFLDEPAADWEWLLLGDPALRPALPPGEGRRYRFARATSGIYSIREQWEMARLSRNADILHTPHFNAPWMCASRQVVTVHDLIYLRREGATRSILGKFYVSALLERITQRANAILTVSEYTKKDLLSYFPKTAPERIWVTPEAASPIFIRMEDRQALLEFKEKYELRRPFVLFVGSLKTHKNVPTLIRAMEIFRREKKIDAELIVVGRQDAKDKAVLSQIEAASGFARYLGELPDAALVSLYNLCEVFVLPSFWEGFGLPLLEAMSCGAPVIASDRTSLPEIVGEAGLLFDPDSSEALAESIGKVFGDGELRTKLSRMGLVRSKEFSWKKTAAQTLSVYKKVLDLK